jgi:glycosyltransferase involved in cell wall biosynthesis
MNYPKILIIGQYFNLHSGGGITLSNLFSGWDKDKIAVISENIFDPNFDVCEQYYQLGSTETIQKFPFNLFPGRRLVKSFIINRNVSNVSGTSNLKSNKAKSLNFYIAFLRYTGLIYYKRKYKISSELLSWLKSYSPDIIYSQLSTLELIRFIYEIHKIMAIPIAIHIMDDWPSTICKNGLFRNYWRKILDNDFRRLLSETSIFLSISNKMSEEYLRRYDKYFHPFHNPINTEIWSHFCKTEFKMESDHVRILYSGRIGVGITESLIEIAKVLDVINNSWGKVKLYIQSPFIDAKAKKLLQKFESIILNTPLSYSVLPSILSQADILVIANGFDIASIDFLRYSMPTKVSEYMISGTPILVYAPYETAVSRFFDENECGCCVTEQNPEKLNEVLKIMITDEEYRKKISQNAVSKAKVKFAAANVRKEFQQLFINLFEKNGHD